MMTPLARFALVTALFAAPVAAHAQASVCPTGSLAVLRLSRLTPDGSMAGLKKAVADHQQWYVSHGYTADVIELAPVVNVNPAARSAALSADQVMTLHLKATDVPQASHDAAWDAYVAEYNKNSTIVSTTVICMP